MPVAALLPVFLCKLLWLNEVYAESRMNKEIAKKKS